MCQEPTFYKFQTAFYTVFPHSQEDMFPEEDYQAYPIEYKMVIDPLSK